ncbi:hypothetical protein [Candidatus Laterigemmans baculatus]|nr:hypothetical protein [Candidatus Laterigemmans baculatus]
MNPRFIHAFGNPPPMEPLSNVRQNVSGLLKVVEQREKTANEVAFAVLNKQQEATKQAGAAVNEMLSQAVEMSRQLAAGQLDVRA